MSIDSASLAASTSQTYCRRSGEDGKFFLLSAAVSDSVAFFSEIRFLILFLFLLYRLSVSLSLDGHNNTALIDDVPSFDLDARSPSARFLLLLLLRLTPEGLLRRRVAEAAPVNKEEKAIKERSGGGSGGGGELDEEGRNFNADVVEKAIGIDLDGGLLWS